MAVQDPERIVSAVAARVPEASRSLIGSLVRASVDRHQHDRIDLYVPVLVQREVETRLRRLVAEFGADVVRPRPAAGGRPREIVLPDAAAVALVRR